MSVNRRLRLDHMDITGNNDSIEPGFLCKSLEIIMEGIVCIGKHVNMVSFILTGLTEGKGTGDGLHADVPVAHAVSKLLVINGRDSVTDRLIALIITEDALITHDPLRSLKQLLTDQILCFF